MFPTGKHQFKDILSLGSLFLLTQPVLVTSRTAQLKQLIDRDQPQSYHREVAETYVDDIYHCWNPWKKKKDGSISCSEDTYLWNVDELDPKEPPSICNFFDSPESYDPNIVTNLKDDLEPCMLWWIMYYDTRAPTLSPTNATLETIPTNGTINTPIEQVPPADVELPTRDFEAIDVTYFFGPLDPDENVRERLRRRSLLSLDRAELHAITTQHLLETMQAKTGSDIIIKVNLILTSVQVKLFEDSSAIITESISGNVEFSHEDHVLRSSAVQRLAQQAFQSNALDLYVFRLSIADDPSLRNIDHVVLGYVSSLDDDGDDFRGGSLFGRLEWTGPVIAVMAAVIAASMAVCLLAYLLCVGSRSSRRKRHGKKHRHRSENLPPGVSKNQSSGSDSRRTKPSYDEDEEEMRRQQHPHSNFQNQEANGDEDNHSQATSTYSYLQDDNSLSVAPSLLYSIHEGDNNNIEKNPVSMNSPSEEQRDGKKGKEGHLSDRNKSSGVMWSVMDTLKTHFGNDENGKNVKNDRSLADDSTEEYRDPVQLRKFVNKAPTSTLRKLVDQGSNYTTLLGGKESFDNDTSGSVNSVLYDDDKSLISDLGVQRVLQLDEDGGVTPTPTNKMKFDALWADDNTDIQAAKTVRKNNTSKSVSAPAGSSNMGNTKRMIDRVPRGVSNDRDSSINSSKRSVGSRRSAESGGETRSKASSKESRRSKEGKKSVFSFKKTIPNNIEGPSFDNNSAERSHEALNTSNDETIRTKELYNSYEKDETEAVNENSKTAAEAVDKTVEVATVTATTIATGTTTGTATVVTDEKPDVKEHEKPVVKEHEKPDVKQHEKPDVKQHEKPVVKEHFKASPNTAHIKSVRKKSRTKQEWSASPSKSFDQSPQSQHSTTGRSLVSVTSSQASLLQQPSLTVATATSDNPDTVETSDVAQSGKPSTTTREMLGLKPEITPKSNEKFEDVWNEQDGTPKATTGSSGPEATSAIKVGSLVRSFDDAWQEDYGGASTTLRADGQEQRHTGFQGSDGLDQLNSYLPVSVQTATTKKPLSLSVQTPTGEIRQHHNDEKKEDDNQSVQSSTPIGQDIQSFLKTYQHQVGDRSAERSVRSDETSNYDDYSHHYADATRASF